MSGAPRAIPAGTSMAIVGQNGAAPALFARYKVLLTPRLLREANDDDGHLTTLVSHRFSTVRIGDLIVVLDGARAVEAGKRRRADGTRGPLRGAVRTAGRCRPRVSD